MDIVGTTADTASPILIGSITNRTDALLELRSLRMTGGSPSGAVVVDGACAATDIVGVRVENAEAYGVWQRGGTLRAVGLTVRSTWGRYGSLDLGTGVFLADGVDARLALADVSGNEGGGITVDGSSTGATVGLAVISDNDVNPGIDHCAGFPVGVLSRDTELG